MQSCIEIHGHPRSFINATSSFYNKNITFVKTKLSQGLENGVEAE
jgi:hypothetical protein